MPQNPQFLIGSQDFEHLSVAHFTSRASNMHLCETVHVLKMSVIILVITTANDINCNGAGQV